jgi:hypothetical protein
MYDLERHGWRCLICGEDCSEFVSYCSPECRAVQLHRVLFPRYSRGEVRRVAVKLAELVKEVD